jgi:hypothetical protein
MYLANNMQGPYGYQLNSWMGYPAKIKSQQQQQQQQQQQYPPFVGGI